MCGQCGGEGFEVSDEDMPALKRGIEVSEANWQELIKLAQSLRDTEGYELLVMRLQARIGFLLTEGELDPAAFLWSACTVLAKQAGSIAIGDMPPMVTTEQRG